MHLNFCCYMQRVGSEFGLNLPCVEIMVLGTFLITHLNATAYLGIVANQLRPQLSPVIFATSSTIMHVTNHLLFIKLQRRDKCFNSL